jgi:hypothetical protein
MLAMIGRISIVAALLCYLIVVGCVMTGRPTTVSVAHAADDVPSVPAHKIDMSAGDLPYRGVTIELSRIDWQDEYLKCVDEIAALGADTISLVIPTRQENTSSTRIYLDQRITPSVELIETVIKRAKEKKLRVVMMPVVLLDAPRTEREWRGVIDPDQGRWEEWFDSYRSMIGHYAWIAEANKVDVLVVGSELVSTESKGDQWKRTIAEVRRLYKGRLTYSSNWDHYAKIPFWDQLDFIGMNSYWSFAKGSWKPGKEKDVTLEDITARWKEIKAEVLGFAESKGKPLLFMEVGWCSVANMAHEPWDYTRLDAPLDLELQRKLYEGFFRSWQGEPNLGGFMIWEWVPGDGGPEDRGYTPENKPAEKVIREWLGKPWK